MLAFSGSDASWRDIVGDPQTLDRDVGVAADRGVDRDEIVLARELHAIAGEIDHRDRIRDPTLSAFWRKSRKLSPQRIAVEIAGADHVEARRLQGLGDQAGIIGRGRERRLGVGAVADDERDPLFLLLRRGGTSRPGKAGQQQQAERNDRKGSGHIAWLFCPDRFKRDAH